MLSTTDDLRIRELKELSTPAEVMREVPRTLTATRVVMAARNAIHAILNGTDDRLLVVVGPCSVHDPAAAVDYAGRLAALREKLADRLEITHVHASPEGDVTFPSIDRTLWREVSRTEHAAGPPRQGRWL